MDDKKGYVTLKPTTEFLSGGVDMVQLNRNMEIENKMSKIERESQELVNVRVRVDELEESLPNTEDELKDYARDLLRGDKDVLRPVHVSYRAAKRAVGEEKVKELCEMFTSIFDNMCSRTCEIEGVRFGNGGRSKLTVGKKGFGIRWNIKSEELRAGWHSKEIFQVIENHELIAKYLDEHRMKPFGERLRRFAKSGVFLNATSLTVEREVPPGICIQAGYGSRYREVKCVRLRGGEFSADVVRRHNGDNDEDELEECRIASYESGYDGSGDEFRVHRPYGYLKLRSFWLEVAEGYRAECETIRVNAESKMAELKESFKREMTLLKM